MPLSESNTIEPAQTTAERIADILRTAILHGDFDDGESLRQDELAQQLKVSKIPLREALVLLQAEGLVMLVPNKGATVAALTAVEMREIYAIRIALETLALQTAFPHLQETHFLTAEAILNRIDHLHQPEALGEWASLNWQFHATLYQPSGMNRLLDITATLHTNVVRYLLTKRRAHPQELTQSQAEHRQLLALCRARDEAGACQLLTRHLAQASALLSAEQ